MNNFISNILVGAALLPVAIMPAACSEDNETSYSSYPAPTITSHFPDEAFPTGVVTIKGTEFGSERTERVGRVYFGGVEATEYVSWSDTEIQVRVPDGAKSGDITLWVWKNNTVSNKEFQVLPGAVFDPVEESIFPTNDVTLTGRNFEYYIDRGVTANDIVVEFPTEENESGILEVTPKSFDSTSITLTVPDGAKGGDIYVRFGDWQRAKGPSLSIIGDVPDIVVPLGSYVKIDGKIEATDEGIGNDNRGAYTIYEVSVPVDGCYDVIAACTTNQNYNCYVNMDFGTDLNELAGRMANDELYRTIEKLGWANSKDYNWGSFYLKADKKYYLKLYLWADGTPWVANIYSLYLKFKKTPGDTVYYPDGARPVYNLYSIDFSNDNFRPFTEQWAWDPCYIKAIDGYGEFYYNYEALKNDNRRERRGCELICDFATATEGWYGFKIYLPEGKFPMNEDGVLIAQLFQKGCNNTWAGHLGINKGMLRLSHRHASIEPQEKNVGQLETNKWYDVVVYFKVGKNRKGNIKVWLGEDGNIVESNPTVDTGNIDFGFGHWIDDETLDNTGNNEECKNKNDYGGRDCIGCKFGLYVQNQCDITIRFDDIKVLDANPAGAFNLVKP